MAFFEGCPVGWGGLPTGAGLVDGGLRALIPGEGVREGLAWWGKGGWVPMSGRGVREAGQGLGGGCKGFGSGGVSGRGRANFATGGRIFVVSNAYKKKKNGFFLKDALWGGGGVPTGAGLVDGGGRPRALIPGEGVREGLAWRGKAG